MTSTAPASLPQVTIGVDTHKHFHVAHAADKLGRPLGSYTMPTTSIGYGDFLAWAQGLGHLEVVGIEGVGHYGAGLGRHLRAVGVRVTEVGRPSRQRRARHGKTDSVDAAGAAAMVLAGEDLGDPKTADGITEMLRVLRIARVSAVRARAKAFNASRTSSSPHRPTYVNSSPAGTNSTSSGHVPPWLHPKSPLPQQKRCRLR